MHTTQIRLHSLAQMERFLESARRLSGQVQLMQEDCIVDGKAVLGLLSLDFQKLLTVVSDACEEEWEQFLACMAPAQVQ